MSDHKKKALRKLLKLMMARQGKKMSPYAQGAKLSGMSGYLPSVGSDKNMNLQRKKLNSAKPYDRIEEE